MEHLSLRPVLETELQRVDFDSGSSIRCTVVLLDMFCSLPETFGRIEVMGLRLLLAYPSAMQESRAGLGTVANNSGQQTPNGLFPKRPSLNAAIPIEIVESALPVVEYTVVSSTRDARPEFSEPETLNLRRERMKLRIHLLLGSEEGRYSVRFQQETDGKAVFSQ